MVQDFTVNVADPWIWLGPLIHRRANSAPSSQWPVNAVFEIALPNSPSGHRMRERQESLRPWNLSVACPEPRRRGPFSDSASSGFWLALLDRCSRLLP